VTRGQRARIARLKQRRRPQEWPDNFDSLPVMDQMLWCIKNGVYEQVVVNAAEKREAAERQVAARAAGETHALSAHADPVPEMPVPEMPLPEMIAPPSVAPAKPEPPAEPLPPPAPRYWWEEYCQWRVRGPNDYDYDDQEIDEPDEWDF
jgi:hypothetical protein